MMIKNQVGIIGLLATLADKHDVTGCVCYDRKTVDICHLLGIKVYRSVSSIGFVSNLESCDLLLSVHGGEIVIDKLLELPKIGCINVHPMIDKYKGKLPVQKALFNQDTIGSVGSHWMTKDVDEGEIICLLKTDIEFCKNEEQVYNRLYELYVKVILATLHSPDVTGMYGSYEHDLIQNEAV